ncbi:PAS domain-containing protein [Streptomyces sp. NPDC047002]|uniref:PAS domain-containing protein n=1 Tax=Streptomyces sp. NPDC047002 TaxID=3155475 RepID=UPI003456F2E6
MDSGFPPGLSRQVAAAGRIPLAVAVVDRDGLVSHWSTGARRLFGHSDGEARGRRADDLMPVAGALAAQEQGVAHGPSGGRGTAAPAAGLATACASDGARTDVLWWAYPLAGASDRVLAQRAGHLVLAADTRGLTRGGPARLAHGARVMPGFARPGRFRGAHRLGARLPYILPAMARADAVRLAERVLELGYPVLEFSHCEQVPVTPVRYLPHAQRRTPCGSPAATG